MNARRVAVRSIAWSNLADSQTKCNTYDAWREGKKKGLEGGGSWPEDGDEVSATQWGRTKRAGGVALGGTEAGGDCAGAWASSQHGVAGTQVQRGALRRLVSDAARPAAGARPALSLATQQPVWRRTLGARGSVVAARVEPRTSLRALALGARVDDHHETIYRHIWRDLRSGGTLHEHLRAARKSCRKRYGRYDSRGRLAGKRMIGEATGQRGATASDGPLGDRHDDGREPGREQPLRADPRRAQERLAHDRETPGPDRGRNQPGLAQTAGATSGRMRTITADNGTEFHWYGQVEAVSPVKFYFATPHHSWERGTNANTNGLIRQYLPKAQTMARVTQSECDLIAQHLNNRPRKRHGYKTPNQCFLTN
jgi:hypothetical protein